MENGFSETLSLITSVALQILSSLTHVFFLKASHSSAHVFHTSDSVTELQTTKLKRQDKSYYELAL